MMRRILSRSGCLLFLFVLSVPLRAWCEPSVLVQTIPLLKGSLPRVVTAYGNVQAGSTAALTIMAPVSAVVGEVYVRQGEAVSKNASLLQLMPSPKAASDFARASAALRVATNLRERTMEMLKQHLATAQQLAQAQNSETDAQAALSALKVQGADGAHVLKAPAGAIVTGLSTSSGAIVAEGTPLLKLAKSRGLVLRVGVFPADAVTIAPGNEASIKAIDGKKIVSGKVALRGSVVDSGTGLVPVEIALPAATFYPGEMAEASITTGKIQGYVVPHAAVLVNDKGAPYVVQAVNGAAKLVEVHVLGSHGDKDVVVGPLDFASPLVLTGNYQLRDEMKLRQTDAGGNAKP